MRAIMPDSPKIPRDASKSEIASFQQQQATQYNGYGISERELDEIRTIENEKTEQEQISKNVQKLLFTRPESMRGQRALMWSGVAFFLFLLPLMMVLYVGADTVISEWMIFLPLYLIIVATALITAVVMDRKRFKDAERNAARLDRYMQENSVAMTETDDEFEDVDLS